jgi:hypothetical protein
MPEKWSTNTVLIVDPEVALPKNNISLPFAWFLLEE